MAISRANSYYKININGTSVPLSEALPNYDGCAFTSYSNYKFTENNISEYLQVWTSHDEWNDSMTVPQYKNNGYSISSIAFGTKPTLKSKLFEGGTANGNDLTIERYQDKLRLRHNFGNGTTVFDYPASYFHGGVVPTKLFAVVQGAGGAGVYYSSWGYATGGAGALWAGIVTLTAGNVVFSGGSGADNTYTQSGASMKGKDGSDTYLKIRDTKYRSIGGGKSGVLSSSSATNGKGGEVGDADLRTWLEKQETLGVWEFYKSSLDLQLLKDHYQNFCAYGSWPGTRTISLSNMYVTSSYSYSSTFYPVNRIVFECDSSSHEERLKVTAYNDEDEREYEVINYDANSNDLSGAYPFILTDSDDIYDMRDQLNIDEFESYNIGSYEELENPKFVDNPSSSGLIWDRKSEKGSNGSAGFNYTYCTLTDYESDRNVSYMKKEFEARTGNAIRGGASAYADGSGLDGSKGTGGGGYYDSGSYAIGAHAGGSNWIEIFY